MTPPPDAGEALARSEALVKSGQDDAAVAVLREAREASGFDFRLDQAEWQILSRVGRIDELEAVFERCLRHAPEHWLGHVVRCWFCFRKARWAECLAAARELAARFPQVFEGHYFAALSLGQLGQGDASLAAHAELAERFPDRAEGWLGQVAILGERGEFKVAREVLRRGVGRASVPAAVVRRYVELVANEGSDDHDLEAEAVAELALLCRQSASLGAFLIAQLRGRVDRQTRRRVLDDFLAAFPDDGELIEQDIRERFAGPSSDDPPPQLLRLVSESGADPHVALLWTEYLVRNHRWEELGAHLSARAGAIRKAVDGVNTAQFVLDALWLCEHHGAATTLGYDDIPMADARLSGALAAWRAADPLHGCDGPLAEWRARIEPVPYLRLHSFAHSSWRMPIAGLDGRAIERIALAAFMRSQPFSLIRLGDGEGNFLAGDTLTIGSATARLTPGHGMVQPALDAAEFADLRARFVDALRQADIVGIPNDFTIRVSRAMMNAVRVFGEEIAEFAGAFTDNAAHYAMGASGFLERLIAIQLLAGRRIFFVGPHDPARFEGLCVPIGAIERIRIPPQIHFFPEAMETEAHYPQYFPRVLAAIAAAPKNSLVLVGAGILGKIYCGAAKQAGCFAIDIGAIADHWIGRKTRIAAHQEEAHFTAGRGSILDLIAPFA